MDYSPIIEMCLLAVHEKQESAVITICNCSIPSQVMLAEYGRLKFSLENLDENEKKELWDFANTNFPDKTKQQKIDVCKIVLTIGRLLN